MSECSVELCSRPARTRGMCRMHYQRWRIHGDAGEAPPRKTPYERSRRTPEERFWDKADLSEECWNWLGRRDKWGYGYLSVTDGTVLAHRFAFQLIVGPIPEGLTLDHLCRNPSCVNPEHLEPVPLAENIRRSHRARQGDTQ